ncbi:hypothetical protein [Streptomyces sp. NEAU-W12]|uniref:hypothetical protein n=1 Tax=Streptomyces sp. NEAU-W12 TaxID=2994668 RepID=UPI003A4C5491
MGLFTREAGALCCQNLGVLHGLVAVRFDGTWHRQDPRGGKPAPGLAWSASGSSSRPTLRPPLLYAAPRPVVRKALQAAVDGAHLRRTPPAALPDLAGA